MMAHAVVGAVPPAAAAIAADDSTDEAAADDGSTEVTTGKAGMEGGHCSQCGGHGCKMRTVSHATLSYTACRRDE